MNVQTDFTMVSEKFMLIFIYNKICIFKATTVSHNNKWKRKNKISANGICLSLNITVVFKDLIDYQVWLLTLSFLWENVFYLSKVISLVNITIWTN